MMCTKEYAIRFDVELLEDTHAGTGMGILGLVDDAQARDAEGRPTIPAPTLRGLIREAAEDYALMLEQVDGCEKAAKEEREAITKLLGRPDMDGGTAVVTALRTKPDQGKDDSTIVWMSTSREVHSRRPQDQTLRSQEYARASLVLSGQIRVEGEESDAERIVKWLKRVAAVGGGKTRGWGRIQVMPKGHKPSGAVAEVARLPAEDRILANSATRVPSDLKPQKISGDPDTPDPDLPKDGPVRLRLALKNVEPLNLSAVVHTGNVIDTQTFISGQTLRGALLTWINRRNPGVADALAVPSAMHVGNAYPVPHDVAMENGALVTAEIVPMPLTLQAPKAVAGETTVPWWTEKKASDNLLGRRGEQDQLGSPQESKKDGEKGKADELKKPVLKRIRDQGWLVRSQPGDCWERTHPKITVRLRNRVPTDRLDPAERRDKEKKPDPSMGWQDDALFSEEVLLEDQTFVCDLWFRDKTQADEFLSATKGLRAVAEEQRSWLRVGRGGRPVEIVTCGVLSNGHGSPPERDGPGPASAERGSSACHDGQAADDAEAHGAGVGVTAQTLTITLTSDLIARTKWLTFVEELDIETLTDLVKDAEPASASLAIPGVKPVSTGPKAETRFFCEPETIYGYSKSTGLPRPPAIAIRKGSVFRYAAEPGQGKSLGELRDALLTLAARGVGFGERTEEGFGRFAVDLDVHTPEYVKRYENVAEDAAKVQSSESQTGETRWQEEVLQMVDAFMKQLGKDCLDPRGKDAPSVSQWQWLRQQVQVCQAFDGEPEVPSVLAALKRIDDHAGRLSGTAWKNVRENLRQRVNTIASGVSKDEEKAERTKLFIDALVRRLVAKNRRDRHERRD